MTESYLIVTENLNKSRHDLNKKVTAQGKKASTLAHQYQSELNKGRGWQDLALNNETFFTVCAIPYAQAREYRNFEEWENQI